MHTSNYKLLSSRTETHTMSLVWCYLDPICSCPCLKCSVSGEPNSCRCCQRSTHCTSMQWSTELPLFTDSRSALHLIYTSDTDKFLSQTRCSPGAYPFTPVLFSHSKTQRMEYVSFTLPDKHFAFHEGRFIMVLGGAESRQVRQSDFRQGKTQTMRECLITLQP